MPGGREGRIRGRKEGMALAGALVGPSDARGAVAAPCALAGRGLGAGRGRVQEGDQHLGAAPARSDELSTASGDGQTLPLHPWVSPHAALWGQARRFPLVLGRGSAPGRCARERWLALHPCRGGMVAWLVKADGGPRREVGPGEQPRQGEVQGLRRGAAASLAGRCRGAPEPWQLGQGSGDTAETSPASRSSSGPALAGLPGKPWPECCEPPARLRPASSPLCIVCVLLCLGTSASPLPSALSPLSLAVPFFPQTFQ